MLTEDERDEYIRMTRPRLARQSWYVTAAYVLVFEAANAIGQFAIGASVELAMLLMGPAAVYLGVRTIDKWREQAEKQVDGK